MVLHWYTPSPESAQDPIPVNKSTTLKYHQALTDLGQVHHTATTQNLHRRASIDRLSNNHQITRQYLLPQILHVT